ncbi:MAG: hypothetical protein AB7T49_10480 [Oligoflexales bacterium]
MPIKRFIAFLLSVLLASTAHGLDYQSKYDNLIQEERANNEEAAETFASGTAALVIGLYGYYNDQRGVSTKVIYSLMQTTGVVLLSESVREVYSPSLLLAQDRYFREKGEISYLRFKKGVVRVTARAERAKYTQLAYTSAILSGLYSYNGYRERNQIDAIKNVFYFLSFNFFLVSGFSFYQAYFVDPLTAYNNGYIPSNVALSVFPIPQITIQF